MHTQPSRAPPTQPVRYVIRREAATHAELLARSWTHADLHELAWPVVVHTYAVDRSGREQSLAHHERSSPSGFEFGYHGSGPAERARCILLIASPSTRPQTRPTATHCPSPVSSSNANSSRASPASSAAHDRRGRDRHVGARAVRQPSPLTCPHPEEERSACRTLKPSARRRKPPLTHQTKAARRLSAPPSASTGRYAGHARFNRQRATRQGRLERLDASFGPPRASTLCVTDLVGHGLKQPEAERPGASSNKSDRHRAPGAGRGRP